MTGALRMQDRKITDNEISGGGMQDWNITDKSEGLENAGQENDGQKCMAAAWHNVMTWRDDAETRNKHLSLMFCTGHCSHVRRVIPILFTHAALMLHNTTVTSAQYVGDTCVVCLMAPRDGVALVPCFHSRFCGACAATVATMDNSCPVCRTRIDMVMRRYN